MGITPVAQDKVNLRRCDYCQRFLTYIEEYEDSYLGECHYCGEKSRKIIPKKTKDEKENLFHPIKLSRDIIFSSEEKIPQYNIDIENQIFSSFDENIKKNTRTYEYSIFSRFERIAANKTAMRAYKLILMKGASFAKEIQYNCDMCEASAYRAIDTLLEMDLVKPIAPVKLRKAAGPKPIIYGLHDATDDEEQKAAKRYIRSRTKAYKKVQTLKQLCLKEIIDESIQYSKILNLARIQGGKGFHFVDLAEMAAHELHDDGIKVVR